MYRSRVSVQEKTRLENIARPIARAYVRRAIEERDCATAQSFIPVLRDVLLRGCFAGGNSSGLRMSARQQWVLQVAFALRSVGDQQTVSILLARLTGPQRTQRSSWEAIVAGILRACNSCHKTAQAAFCPEHRDMTPDTVAAIYDVAIGKFVEIVERDGITSSYVPESEISRRYASSAPAFLEGVAMTTNPFRLNGGASMKRNVALAVLIGAALLVTVQASAQRPVRALSFFRMSSAPGCTPGATTIYADAALGLRQSGDCISWSGLGSSAFINDSAATPPATCTRGTIYTTSNALAGSQQRAWLCVATDTYRPLVVDWSESGSAPYFGGSLFLRHASSGNSNENLGIRMAAGGTSSNLAFTVFGGGGDPTFSLRYDGTIRVADDDDNDIFIAAGGATPAVTANAPTAFTGAGMAEADTSAKNVTITKEGIRIANPGAAGADAAISFDGTFGCWCNVTTPGVDPAFDLHTGQPFTIGGETGCFVQPSGPHSFVVVASCSTFAGLHYSGVASNQAWSYPAVSEPSIMTGAGKFQGRDIYIHGQEGDTSNVATFSGSSTQKSIVTANGYPLNLDSIGVVTALALNDGAGVAARSTSGVAGFFQTTSGAVTVRALKGSGQATTDAAIEIKDGSTTVVKVRFDGTIVRGTVTDSTGAGAPSGACGNGSTYHRTDAGATDPPLYTCRNSAWVAGAPTS